jgi:hypothetical protein
LNEFLTVYLRTLNALSGGQMSPARAMDSLIDFISAAEKAKATFGRILKPEGHGPTGDGGRHA